MLTRSKRHELASELRWRLAMARARAREAVTWKLAYMLPRSVVGIAYVRVVAEATTGRYAGHDPDVTRLAAMEAIRRFDRNDAYTDEPGGSDA